METLIWWEHQWQRDHQIHTTLYSVPFQPFGTAESWRLNHSARKPLLFHQINIFTWSQFFLLWQFAVQHNFCNTTRGPRGTAFIWAIVMAFSPYKNFTLSGIEYSNHSEAFASKLMLTLPALQAYNVFLWERSVKKRASTYSTFPASILNCNGDVVQTVWKKTVMKTEIF